MERSKDWIDEAEGDLEHAKSDAGGGFYNWACFSAQQSAEKSAQALEKLSSFKIKLEQILIKLFSKKFKSKRVLGTSVPRKAVSQKMGAEVWGRSVWDFIR